MLESSAAPAAATATALTASIAPPAALTATAKACSTGFLVANEVEAIDEVHHDVAVDGVGPGVAAVRGAVVAADARTVAQDVVPLDADGCVLLLKEVLAELCIPDELVGVHGGVVVAATALLGDVAAELHVPRHVDDDVAAVVVEPGVAIAALLHVVAGVLVVHAAVDAHFEQVVAEIEAQVLAQAGAAGGGLLEQVVVVHVAEEAVHIDGTGDEGQCSSVEIAADVTHTIGVVDVLVPVQVEVFLFAQSCVEAHPSPRVPAAVDVHGTAIADAGSGVVDGGVGDAAAIDVGAGVDVPPHLLVGDVVVVVDIEAVAPGALQSCVTGADIEGVAVVHDLDEVGHGGLRHVAVVADAQLAGVRYLPADVQARCPVLDVANGIDMDASLVVSHIGALWLPVDTQIEVQFLPVLVLAVVAQHEVDSLVELLIGGVLAVHDVAFELREVDAIIGEVHAVVGAIVQVNGGDVGEASVLKGFLEFLIDHHLAVGILEAVLRLVARLHDGSLQDGLCVADASLPAVVLGGREDVLVVGIQAAIGSLVILNDGTAVRLVIRFAIGALQVEGNVSARHAKPTIDLQLAIDVVVVAVAIVQAVIAVDENALEFRFLRAILLDGVGQASLEGTRIEGYAIDELSPFEWLKLGRNRMLVKLSGNHSRRKLALMFWFQFVP